MQSCSQGKGSFIILTEIISAQTVNCLITSFFAECVLHELWILNDRCEITTTTPFTSNILELMDNRNIAILVIYV